jgi:hypothetical protein
MSARNRYFANEGVRYYGEANCSQATIEQDERQFCQKWPIRHYDPVVSDFSVRPANEFNILVVKIPFHWQVSNQIRSLHGTSMLICHVQTYSDGSLKITEIQESKINE